MSKVSFCLFGIGYFHQFGIAPNKHVMVYQNILNRKLKK